MATKRKTRTLEDREDQRREARLAQGQSARQAAPSEPPPRSHNVQGGWTLSIDEDRDVGAGREAFATLKQTFENWLVIGRALKVLRNKADAIGGKFTFDKLRDREGLGPKELNKGRVSRLLAIIDNQGAVGAWRVTITPKQQFAWCSPEAVHRHCPVFAKDKQPKPAKGGAAKPDGPDAARAAYVAALASMTREQKMAELIKVAEAAGIRLTHTRSRKSTKRNKGIEAFNRSIAGAVADATSDIFGPGPKTKR